MTEDPAIYDVRLTRSRDGTWRASIDGRLVAQGHATAADAARRVAERLDRRNGVEAPPAQNGGQVVGRKMQSVTVYLRPDQIARLDAEAERTRLPVAVLIRDAIDATYPAPVASPLARGRVATTGTGQSAAAGEEASHPSPAARAPTPARRPPPMDPEPEPGWLDPEPGSRRLLAALDDEEP